VKSVTPGQMIVKIIHDQLIETLGATADPIDLNAPAPVPIMMVGLQGSGKTTTTAKIARRFGEQIRRKTLMASLDTKRPAAMEQLAVLGKPVDVDTLRIVAGRARQIARRASSHGSKVLRRGHARHMAAPPSTRREMAEAAEEGRRASARSLLGRQPTGRTRSTRPRLRPAGA
jgi:hypothetical protein